MNIIKTLKSSISEKGNYCYSLPVETTKEIIKDVKQLQQENKKYKEVINKTIEYINENWGHWCSNHCKYATETIEILKGSGINE